MQHEVYKNFYTDNTSSIFEFLSVGKKGIILKRIVFEPTEYNNVYNLVFGDIDIDGEINDKSTSNNGDRNKILATLMHAIDTYLNLYPERIITFTGSTLERTRLYRIAISLNIEYLATKFIIYCQNDNGIFPFEKGKEINSFLIKKKV